MESFEINEMKVLLPNVNVSTLLSSHYVDLSSATEVTQENNINPALIDQIDQSLNVESLISSDDVDDYLQRLASEIPDENSAAIAGIQEVTQNKEVQGAENEKRNNDVLDTKQDERKPPLKIGRRQTPQKTAARRNPMNLVHLHPPKIQRRTTMNHQANGSSGMLARGSRIRISSNSLTVAHSPQREWNHRPKPIVSSLPNVERVRMPENKSPVYGNNRNPMNGMITLNQLPRINQRHHVQQIPVQHMENEYFVAVTHCHGCNGRKEHLLSRPGMWPPASCNYCGSPWHIIRWKTFICEDDDDVVYAGEVVNTPKSAQKPKRPVFYGSDGIKLEPMDEFDNVPPCRRCGGLHIQRKGQPYPPGYCPNYHGSFSGSNLV